MQGRTLTELLSARVEADGDRVAIIDGDAALTFADLQRSADRLAAGLASRGIGRGDRVAIWLPNNSWWLVGFLAIARLGAVCVCVNTRFRAVDLTDILSRSGCRALIYAPRFGSMEFDSILADVDETVLASMTALISCVAARTRSFARCNCATVDDLMQSDAALPVDPAPEDGVVMFTTSGTTSKPKFVLHDHRSQAAHALDVAVGFQYDRPGATVLQALPLCGTFGLAQALGALAAGAPTIILPVFDALQARDLIATNKVTGFNGTDEMFKRIVDGSGPVDLASINWCGFASFAEPRPVEFARECEGRGLKLLGLYGMSEVQALFARQPENLPVEERALAGGALTSKAAAVRIGDPETGADVPDGVSGELYLRGPSLFSKYFGDVAATEGAIGKDGFVRTGDLAHKTSDGRFIFETRMGDSLRLGGYLVNPSEIDAWLEQDGSVASAQTVAAMVDGRLRPISFVISTPGGRPDEQALIAKCRDALARFKVPARVITLENFPSTDGPNGRKIQRGRLRDMATELMLENRAGSG